MNFVSGRTLGRELQSDIHVMLYFWSDECFSCKTAEPFLCEVEQAYKAKLKIVKIDAKLETELAKQFEITTIPTFVIVKNTKPIKKIIGYRDRISMEKELRKTIS